MRRIPFVVSTCLAAALVPAALSVALTGTLARGGEPGFAALVDEYYAGFVTAHPSQATDLGIHEHDAELEDFSPDGVAREKKRLDDWEARFGALDAKKLTAGEAIDLVLVKNGIAAARLELERVRGWKHRADFYPGLANGCIYSIVKRDFAPQAERLGSACSRMEKIPALLAAGRKNLSEVAQVNVAIALEEIPGIAAFFKDDVPRAFPEVLSKKEDPLALRFSRASAATLAALDDYQQFLKDRIAPEAKAPFNLGEELFLAKLRAEEMIDLPLDELLHRGEAELARLQEQLRKTAARIDAKRPIAEILGDLAKDHAPASKLIEETQAGLGLLREFLVKKEIVTIPSEVMPRVEETPAFLRATTFASMFTPGPFEARAKEAMYNVTLPEPGWTPERVEEFMQGRSRPTMEVTSIHEAFPGHYVQFLWLPRVASKVRKFEGCSSNAEGWAHYCEQMVLDEGYGAGNDRLRLAQIVDALLRAARYVVGIRMHTRGMTMPAAEAFFQEEGFQTRDVAVMEVRRGTEDPTYLYYTYGKLEILRLREDYRKRTGVSASLRRFHDAFLCEGSMPLPLVRRVLLGEP